MRRLLILGAGTAGTIAANKLRRRLGVRDWTITVVDRTAVHLYRPGLLAVPFGAAGSEDVVRPLRKQLRRGIKVVQGEIDHVVSHAHEVLIDDGRRIEFDYLVLATGAVRRPDRIPGLVGPLWRRTAHDFSSLTGAIALRSALYALARRGGRLVMSVADESAADLSVALEFLRRADGYLRRTAARDTVEILCATPFAEPLAPDVTAALDDHKIGLVDGFRFGRIDTENLAAVAGDGRAIPFDLLVTVPPASGPAYIGRSRLGGPDGFVPVGAATLQSTHHADMFALGAAADLPAGRAYSAARVSAEVFAENFVRHSMGQPMTASFADRIAGGLRDPATGPAAAWLYWNVLLPGRMPPGAALEQWRTR